MPVTKPSPAAAAPSRAAAALTASFLLLPAAAGARVVVVATGGPQAALVDTGSNKVTGQIGLPGRARAVAVLSDGSRAFVAAGASVVAIDLAARSRAGSVTLASPATSARTVTPTRTRTPRRPAAAPST